MTELAGKVIAKVEQGAGFTQVFFDDGEILTFHGEPLVTSIPDEVLDNLLEDPPEETKEEKTDPEPEKEEAKEEDPEPEKETKEEDPEDYWTRDEIMEMAKKELRELIEDEDLDIDEEDFPTTKKLRKAVIEELGIDD